MSGSRRWTLLTEGVVIGVAALVGLRVGLVPIKDNSSFTHLATGIEMVRDSWLPHIPRVDPYTYTAAGRDWVVQSWLPSWTVGAAERVFGLHAVLMLSGLASCAVGLVMALLARTGSAARTAAVVALTVIVAAQYWAPRPLMVGLVCFGLTVLIVDRRRSPWWLLPLAWVWVQSHGSFPLGVAFLGALWLGECVDRRSLRSGKYERNSALALALGIVLGAINPLGLKLVLFPATAISKRDVFRHIVEWRPLSFDSREGAIAIVGITIAAAILIRRRAPWRVAIPVVVFVLLAFSARRNAPTLAIVLAWGLGAVLRLDAQDEGQRRIDPVIGLAIAAMAAVFLVTAWQGPAINTVPYPVASVRWAEDNERFTAPHRVLTRDFVGNYVELRHGPSRDVFVDDRVDMFPAEVPLAYYDMRKGKGTVATVDRWKVDTVIWTFNDPVTRQLLKAGWRVAYSQRLGERWVVLIR